VKAAKRHPGWVEIEDDVVPRDGGRCLVSAGSDRVYVIERGNVWERGSAALVSDYPGLAFLVRRDDELLLLREQPDSWTTTLMRRARSGSAA